MQERKPAEKKNTQPAAGTVGGKSSAHQFKPDDTHNGISFAENETVRELSGGKVDLHESGASVQQTSASDSRLQSVGARSMAAGGEALIGDSRDRGHEIWHLAQQHMDMVKPTTTVNNTPVNDDPGLEKDADDKGAKIMQAKATVPFAQQFTAQKKSRSGTVQKKSRDRTVQRQVVRGADNEQNTVNLTRTIMNYHDFGTTFVSLNGTEFPAGNADNAVNDPALLMRPMQNGNTAVSIAAEPVNQVSSRIELPTAPLWTTVSTLGYLNGRIFGTGDGFSISEHMLEGNEGAAATLEVCGLPNNPGFAGLVRQHELHHVDDIDTIIDEELRPWDTAIHNARLEGLEINRGSAEEAKAAFYAHLGGTPAEIGNRFKNRLRVMGLTYHQTEEGSSPKINNLTTHRTMGGGFYVRVYFKHPMG
ncbi:MAG: hypothetical protein FD123_3825 [Bacteroidetes bacterium]|nr:MAG: hypothetical protein FD123_3825 [Bacteroidota bacterium]